MSKTYPQKNKAKCRMCIRSLPQQIVCGSCFTEMAVTPFVEFKKLHNSNIEKCQNAIATVQLPQEKLHMLRLRNQRLARIRRLQQQRQLCAQSNNRIKLQQAHIDSAQNILANMVGARLALLNSLNYIESQINKKMHTVEEILREKEKAYARILRLQTVLFRNVYQATEMSMLNAYSPEIALCRLTLPVFDEDTETSVTFETVQIITKVEDEVWAHNTIFYLERVFIRLMLLAKIFCQNVPYSLKMRSFCQMCVVDRRLLLYVEGKIAQIPRNIKLLLSCSRKRKNSIYIDEEVLGFIQTDIDYLLSKVGSNIESDQDRLLKLSESTMEFLKDPHGFHTVSKQWKSYLPCSMMISVERQKLLELEKHQESSQSSDGDIIVIEDTELHSLHTSSEDLDFDVMDLDKKQSY